MKRLALACLLLLAGCGQLVEFPFVDASTTPMDAAATEDLATPPDAAADQAPSDGGTD